jgi:TolA-binding protein
MSQGAWDEAAKKYIQLVDEEPKHEFADKALNNAAVCLREGPPLRERAQALRAHLPATTRRASSPDAALFRVAVNQENSYDFDHAVGSYERLVKEYPASKDREAALYNAARLLEGQQKYPQAAAAYARYADLFPKAEDAPKNQYRAALVYEKQGDTKNEVKALNEFVRRFGGKSNQGELVVEAQKKLGDAYAKSGSPKDAGRPGRPRPRVRPPRSQARRRAAGRGRRRRVPLPGVGAGPQGVRQAEDRRKGKALEQSFTVKRTR